MNVICRLSTSHGLSRLFFFVVLFTLFNVGVPQAVEPNEILKDPKLEERARSLSTKLRCLVCQNQSIDDSDAPLARDLRLLVRERLKAGDSDRDVMDFVVARYGEFVLLSPPLGWHTVLLWFSPLFLLISGIILARIALVRAQKGKSIGEEILADTTPLNADEEQRLKKLLSVDDRLH